MVNLMPDDPQTTKPAYTPNPVAARLRAISTGGGSQPNSKIKDLCSDGAAEIDRLQDAAENVVIAFGMGWDMDGVILKLRKSLMATETTEPPATAKDAYQAVCRIVDRDGALGMETESILDNVMSELARLAGEV
jgi:hypothetical protein